MESWFQTLIQCFYFYYIVLSSSSCLQWMNSIRWFVFWQCVINFVDGFMVYGVISVIIPALEKRYDLSSSKSGLISSANDFGAFVILIFVGYFGERRHKPRIMGVGISLLAFGSLLFSLPQFIGGRYAYTVSGRLWDLFRLITNIWYLKTYSGSVLVDKKLCLPFMFRSHHSKKMSNNRILRSSPNNNV